MWPSLQRDFLLALAAEGLYRPLWSEAILEELQAKEELKLSSRGIPAILAKDRATHLIDQMRRAFDDAIVTGWEKLEGAFDLPDPDDEHVLAAAAIGGAGVLVTQNLKDFPAALLPAGLQVQTACEFAANTVSVNAARAAKALTEIAQRHRSPDTHPTSCSTCLLPGTR